MVSIGGNLYSVPDTARRRILDVHVFADEIRIFENGAVVATHLPLEGRDQTRLDPAHRKASAPARRRPSDDKSIVLRRAGDQVAQKRGNLRLSIVRIAEFEVIRATSVRSAS